jgi:hypothetical protein
LYISIYIYIICFCKDNCQHKYYSYKELICSTKGNINKPEAAKDSPRKVRTTNNKNTEKSEKGQETGKLDMIQV